MQRNLHIVIGCDTDPDRIGFLPNVPSGTLTWRGMLEGIPRLKERVAQLKDASGHSPVFTWLLRVDEQVRHVHGDYAWVLSTHRSFLEGLEQTGDELGWHPHFWRHDDGAKRWYQDAKDISWQLDMLRNAHAAYMRVLPERAKSVRMGWDYHNNDTLATLASLGVRVDFSALPGISTLGGHVPQYPENLFDWYITPRYVYRPSAVDYRRPARAGESPLGLLEAPNTVSTSRIWGLISGLQMARKMKDAGHIARWMRRPTYWINITGKPKLFAPILGALRSELRRPGHASRLFVTYFHPDELLENNSSLYNLESAHANIKSVLDLCESESVSPHFTAAASISETIQSLDSQ